MHRPGFATSGQRGTHRRQQALGEQAFGVLEGIHHRLDHFRRGQQVAGRHALFAGPRMVDAERLAAGEQRGAAVLVDHRDLAILAIAVAAQRLVQRFARGQALVEAVEDLRAERRQGDVLRSHRAGAGAQPGTTGADGDARRADGDAQLAGFGAAADDGQGHGARLLIAASRRESPRSRRSPSATAAGRGPRPPVRWRSGTPL